MDTSTSNAQKSGVDSILEYKEICDEFVFAVGEFFPAKIVAFAYISGTFSYGGSVKGKSDVDITIVFKKEVGLVDPGYLHGQIKLFIEKYRSIHDRFGYASDAIFPGEYVTVMQIDDAILGRGFTINGDGELFLPTASNEYYLANKEHWYRAWLSSMAFSTFLCGDQGLMVQYKQQAWRTITLFLLSQYKPPHISSKGLIEKMLKNENKWEGVGVTARYKTFLERELATVEKVFLDLAIEGFVSPGSLSEEYEVNLAQVAVWVRETASSLRSNQIRNASFLLETYE